MPKPRKRIKVPGYEGPDRRSGTDRRKGTRDRRIGPLTRRSSDRRKGGPAGILNRIFNRRGKPKPGFWTTTRRLGKVDRRDFFGKSDRREGERRVLREVAAGKGLDHISVEEVGKLVKMAEKHRSPAEHLLSYGLNAKELKRRDYVASRVAFEQIKSHDPEGGNYYRPTNINAGELKKVGFGAKEIYLTFKHIQGLEEAVSELTKAGFSTAELREAGFNAKNLRELLEKNKSLAGTFNAQKLKNAGFTVKELKKAGFGAQKLKQLGFPASELLKAGYSKQILLLSGYTQAEIGKA